MEGSPQDQTPAGVVSEEIISRVATETGLPEKVVRNIIALKSERSAEEMRDMPAERVRDMILDMFRERGATNTEPRLLGDDLSSPRLSVRIPITRCI